MQYESAVRFVGHSGHRVFLLDVYDVDFTLGIMTTTLRTLTEQDFKATFLAPMADVTATAEEVVDLWAYAEPALREAYPDVCSCDWEVKHIYESSDHAFQHVLIPTHVSNLYLVVVVDKKRKSVLGHHLLDLGALYGVPR